MPDAPDRKSLKRRWLIVIISGVFLLLALAAVFVYLNRPQSPWAPATMEYGDCGDDCVDLGSRHLSHVGDVQFYYDKDVDDAVVQWGTCLESAISCIKAAPKDDASRISRCVAASSCPKSCLADYAGQVKPESGLEDQLASFQAVFLKEGSLCRPAK